MDQQEISNSPKPKPKKDVNPGKTIDTFAAQCMKCLKWRVIHDQEEYEEIRSKMSVDPFNCEKKQDLSCEVPADIDYDNSRTWVMDKPGIPKTPRGFKRSLVLRKDYSKMDTYYFTPTGKKLRSRNEIASFIEANPEYKDAPLEHFNFTVPKVMEDTIPVEIKIGSSSASTSV